MSVQDLLNYLAIQDPSSSFTKSVTEDIDGTVLERLEYLCNRAGGGTTAPARLFVPAAAHLPQVNFTLSAQAWSAANTAYYVPFELSENRTVTKVSFMKGAVAGNVNCALYDEAADGSPGAIIGSALGSTAVSAGANEAQDLNIGDQALAAGRYYLALVFDTVTTLTVSQYTVTAAYAGLTGIYTEASAFTLPATATPVPLTGTAKCPIATLWMI